MTAEAHAAVDRVTRHAEKAGPNASEEDRWAATDAVILEASAEQRAEVLKRHRSEPSIIRKLIGEAVRSSDPTKARIANDVARSLKVVHELKRKAWGLDTNEEMKTIVIERD